MITCRSLAALPILAEAEKWASIMRESGATVD